MSFVEVILVISGLGLAFSLIVFVIISLLCTVLGAPFVPATHKDLAKILKEAKLKKGQLFYDLGSGDGRVVRMAVLRYGVLGVGVETHPLLVLYSQIMGLVLASRKIKFKWANVFNVNLSDADVIYVFLLPQALKKLERKFLKECKRGTMIISHGFALKGLDHLLVKQINNNQLFPTRFYRIK